MEKNVINTLTNIGPAWARPLTYPEGLTPKRFQFDAALFALSRRRSYLALDPGLGKTIVAALIRRALSPAPCVYICPPFLVATVESEFQKWGALDRTYIFPDSKIDRPQVREAILNLARLDGAILIIDEAHRFKNAESKRGKALYSFADKFSKTVLLSGTPMPNRPIELYASLSNLVPEAISKMNKFQFGLKYCAGRRSDFGWDFSGASNLEELAKKIKNYFLLRLKKTEVMPELPLKTEELVLIGDNLPPKVAAIDRKILKEFSPEDLLKNLAPNNHVATYRKELGSLKAPHAVKIVSSILKSTDESVLLFALHKNVVAELEEGLTAFKPFVITGDTPMRKRYAIVNEFQTSIDRRLFIGNIDACGLGFTLTKATRVVFAEFSWTPSVNAQASDRAHRIGQLDNVLVQYLVFKDSIDRAVIETLLRKQKNIAHI